MVIVLTYNVMSGADQVHVEQQLKITIPIKSAFFIILAQNYWFLRANTNVTRVIPPNLFLVLDSIYSNWLHLICAVSN